MSTKRQLAEGATISGLNPGMFPVGSPESRAAARALLQARLESQYASRSRIVFQVIQPAATKPLIHVTPERLVIEKAETRVSGKVDLEKSSCTRMLDSKNNLLEFVFLDDSSRSLSDAELDKFVNSFPVGSKKIAS